MDSLYKNTIVVLHLMHSHVPLLTQMILDNFLQSPQTHQHWCFHRPPNVSLVHSNLELQIDTQTWVDYILQHPSLN